MKKYLLELDGFDWLTIIGLLIAYRTLYPKQKEAYDYAKSVLTKVKVVES